MNTNPSNPIVATQTPPAGTFPSLEAFEAVQPEMDRLAPEDLAAQNLDLPGVVVTVRGCGPVLEKHREAIVSQLPHFDIVTYDKIPTYALAAGYAHTAFLATSAPTEPVQDMVDELTKTRELLVADVTTLAKRKLLERSRLGELQGNVGHRKRSWLPPRSTTNGLA